MTTVATPTGNLPAVPALTSLVGRRSEIAEISRRLDPVRLLTLTGVGGVGKTRLAMETAFAVRDRFRDGVWLVDLAPVQEPSAVADQVATALGVPDQGGESVIEQLAGLLAEHQALIVLDHCEHLGDACAELVCTLLVAAPGLRVLATSRHTLGVRSEHLYTVAPLRGDDAAELLRQRATEAHGGNRLRDASPTDVARLCAQLDGLPLAIELAASRLRTLAVEQLADRLAERLGTLDSGRRTGAPRQSTMTGAIDYSYELCDPAERLLWNRLSVFAGGFCLEAAEDVCSGDGIARADVVDILDRLVAQSVVLPCEQEGQPRYRLLETIRQYGRERLTDVLEEQRLRRRHRDYFLSLAQRLTDRWYGPGQVADLARLRVEHRNLLTALSFDGDPQTTLALAAALRYHWCAGGFLGEGRRSLERALAAAPAPTRGARGFLAPSRTDGEYGHMLHFNSGSFPGEAWTGGADWLLYPLLEHYEVTGDADFLKNKLGPALMELALFYEDFLTRTDSGGKAVFVPSYSMENTPASTGQALSINATADIMAGRHALQAAIDAANTLNVEQGSGQGVQRWTALLAKLPDYTINGDGALAEWSWPGLTDRYNHRHVSHLYGAWPLHEINPEDEPDLVRYARKALDKRGDENYSAHGSLHRALARSCLKDAPGVYGNLLKIYGKNMVWRCLMTSHNPNLDIYNCDAANTIPGILGEALVYSRPGVLEILPALPDQLDKGTIKGVRGRNRITVRSLAWDTAARAATVQLTSDIDQDITFICRRGITSVTTSATVTTSSLGNHARVVSLTAGTITTIAIGLLTGPFKLVNRNSGKVMEVSGASTSNGASVIQWPWSGSANQQWKLLPDYDGSYRLSNVNSGKVLDNPGGSTSNGTALDQWSDTNGSNQWWKLVPAATSGYYRLVNVQSGLCADVLSGSTADGAKVIQWPSNSGANQEWQPVGV
ncbi:glycosyl hydrolase family 95 catalytic domain-containing protein [Streptomyces sp. NPDC051677]|uniref:glycosyl hydrolase family 95 catalytic domain-containing protein n=1 Tax=Streptomyces sp. NPDC051677 TaxID=3365669 RepID=UPI0037D8146D